MIKRSIYQEIELPSEKEFMNLGPPEFTSSVDEHDIMLNRLKFELQERVRLDSELALLKATRDERLQRNKGIMEELDQIDKEVEQLVQVRINHDD